MTFAEITAAILDEVGNTTGDARTTARVRRFINEGLRAVVGEPGMERLADTDAPSTFASVANQARYVLPENVARIQHITDRTNDWRLTPMPLANYRLFDPDPSANAGTPTHFVPIGTVGVAVQPSDASEVFVDSTSASDTMTAYVEGVITGGYLRKTAVTMTGVTAVSLSTAITSFIELHDFYLSGPANGTVTLHEDASGGTELARITIGQMRPKYYGFYLWPTPSGVTTYYVDARRALEPLVANTDEPPWTSDYHDVLVAYGAYREWMFKGDTDRAGEAQGRYKHGLSRLKYATQTDSDEILVMGRQPLVGRSRLGGFFPADHWGR
jgi:hypothetical protein